MIPDLPERIRRLTSTEPLTVDDVVSPAVRPRRPWAMVAGATAAVVALVAVLLVVAAGRGGSQGRQVQVSVGGQPGVGACGLTTSVRSAGTTPAGAPAGTTPPRARAGATRPAAPLIRTTAVVFAPIASTKDGGQQQVTVGLNATEQFGADVTVRRVPTSGRTASFRVSEYAGDVAVGASSTHDFGTMRAGDLLEIQFAIREANPDASTFARSIALRMVDLRTGQSVQSGDKELLDGAPAAPTKLASSTHRDVSITETTWKRGWPDTAAGLADELTSQTPVADDTFVGVTQRRSDFFITDQAHYGGRLQSVDHRAVRVSTAKLHAETGDRVTVEASTPTLGAHTAVTITDERTNARVCSAG